MTTVDPFAKRAAAAQVLQAVPLVKGKLFPIWLHPNERNDDRITIGVAFVDAAGTSHCKVASDFQFLQCLYGKGVDLDSFTMLGDVLSADLHGTAWSPERPPISDAISYGTARYAAGFSIPEIIERSYALAVAAGAGTGTSVEQPGRARVLLSKELTRQLAATMAKRFGPNAAKTTIGEKVTLSTDFGRAATLRFDLRGPNRSLGELVSAQGSPPTVKSHLQAAVNKALLFRLHAERTKVDRPLAMFILEPSAEEFEYSKNRQQIIDTIGNNVDMATGAGVSVHRAAHLEALAEDVGQWAGLKAA